MHYHSPMMNMYPAAQHSPLSYPGNYPGVQYQQTLPTNNYQNPWTHPLHSWNPQASYGPDSGSTFAGSKRPPFNFPGEGVNLRFGPVFVEPVQRGNGIAQGIATYFQPDQFGYYG